MNPITHCSNMSQISLKHAITDIRRHRIQNLKTLNKYHLQKPQKDKIISEVNTKVKSDKGRMYLTISIIRDTEERIKIVKNTNKIYKKAKITSDKVIQKIIKENKNYLQLESLKK